MKKGANPAVIFIIIDGLVNEGISIDDPNLKNMVTNTYNSIFKLPSLWTKISDFREDAIVEFQETLPIFKIPQDGNGAVDLAAYKDNGGVITFIICQQKGNNASFNGGGKKQSIAKMKEFVEDGKIKDYFHLLPDDLNPLINEKEWRVEAMYGYFLATGSTSYETFPVLSNNDYLNKIGIYSNTIVDLDRWVVNKEEIKNHEYNAREVCSNFDEIYDECLTYYN